MSFLLFSTFYKYLTLYSSMLCKRDPNVWIFGSWFGEKYADNSKFLFEYCVKQGLDVYWITNSDLVIEELKTKGLPVLKRNTPEANRIAKKAKYVVYSTSPEDANFYNIGGAVFINLWHGIPLKKICYDDNLISRNIILKRKIYSLLTYWPIRKKYNFSTSLEVSKIYKSCFKSDDKHIIQVGQARNDCFFDKSLKRIKYKDVDYKKIIFYMPTHRNEGKTKINIEEIFNLKKLNDFCVFNDILFVIKKHFYHRNEYTNLEEYSNILDVTGENLDAQESLFNADILITDYSSCYIDYLLLDRPIIFYNYDFESYIINDREMYFNYFEVTPGPKATNFNEFMIALNDALNGNKKYKNKLKEIKNLFYSKDNQGPVCSKLVEVIKSL